MNKQNDFALVTRPASVVEKAESGAPRILCDMIADTLALAKSHKLHSPRIVILDDIEGLRRCYCYHLLEHFPELEILEFEEGDAAWLELSQTDPDLLITDSQHLGIKGPDMLAGLAERKIEYPIFFISGMIGNVKTNEEMWRARAPNLDVLFMRKPIVMAEFIEAVGRAIRVRPRNVP